MVPNVFLIMEEASPLLEESRTMTSLSTLKRGGEGSGRCGERGRQGEGVDTAYVGWYLLYINIPQHTSSSPGKDV